MGEIRFVGTGETRGYPYLVCKKKASHIYKQINCYLCKKQWFIKKVQRIFDFFSVRSIFISLNEQQKQYFHEWLCHS